MKKFTLFTLLALLVFGPNSIKAQKKDLEQPFVRCGTMEAIEENLKMNPKFKAQLDKGILEYERSLLSRGSSIFRGATLTGPITIPVVVHVVLPNPNIVTEEAIDYFLNRLNLDFSGLNPDSANGALFYNVRGHSLLRFTRARRDPSGNLTNGVERKVGTTLISTNVYQPLKHTSTTTGGLDPWDVTRYYNLWVGDGGASGLLGIAPGIGPGNQTETTTSTVGIDGVCVDYRGFSNSCFADPSFNLARTAVHEIGHNFGLYHTFQGGCATVNDFGQLTTPGCQLPAELLGPADDTPAQNNPTTTCATGVVASGCASSPNPPGRMYQNYMDYTSDACYSMFTVGQVNRMHHVLEICRPGYLTTQGAVAPASAPALDAAPSFVVSPGGSEFNSVTCAITNYPIPTCPGNFTPRISVTNFGTATLTSITVTLTVNGVAAPSQTFSVNLLPGRSAVLVLANRTLVSGPNTLVFTTSAPNGGVDQVTTNDSLTRIVTVPTGVTAIAESFESTAFPPPGWTISAGPGTSNWARTVLAAKTGLASARLNWYGFSTGNVSNLITPTVNLAGGAGSNAILTFHYAYKLYNATSLGDTLDVMVSTDCGLTWTSVWKFGGNTLPTSPGFVSGSYTPTPAEWTQTPITVNLNAYRSGPILIRFRGRSGFGNNLYLDDVNIFVTVNNDAGVSAITSPVGEFCTNTATPTVTVRNFGILPLTSVRINNRVDNGVVVSKDFTGLNIAPGATQNFTLDPITGFTNGLHTFTAYTTLPNGVTDQQPANDTLRSQFRSNVAVNLPIVEGFEGAAFPPPGWTVLNPDNGITWTKPPAGVAKTGTSSAGINIYAYPTVGAVDYLRTPLLNFTPFSGGFVTFHYAYKQYSAVENDSLSLVVSTDCGATWTTLFSRGGPTLSTSPGFATTDFLPTAADWTVNPIRVDLTPYAGRNIFVAFKSTNAFGNNMFIDDVNIFGLYNYDVQMSAITNPLIDVCSVPFTPEVRVTNNGIVTINSLKVNYSIDNGPVVSATFTGMALARDRDTILRLPAVTSLALGNHTFRVYSFEPNGQADQRPINDTLSMPFTLIAPVAAPLVEGFEGTTFPPANWRITQQPVDALTWQRTTAAGRNSSASAYVNNYNYAAAGRVDNLITPLISYSGADSLFLKFDVAATTYSFPGSTATPLDTLEVLVTQDCGRTYTSIYKKFGAELQTIGDVNSPNTDEFFPIYDKHWRKDSINVTRLIGGTNAVRFAFKNTTNFENNIFIDNVNFSPKVLAARLKNNGYMITPNPFTTSFFIQHYLAPVDLRGYGVYNAIGQLVLSRSFNGSADSYMEVNMGHLPSGVYTVKLMYTSKTVSEKVIKLK